MLRTRQGLFGEEGMSVLLRSLEGYRKMHSEIRSHNGQSAQPYSCPEDFVLRHGIGMYGRRPRPYRLRQIKQCFANSQALLFERALFNEKLTYVEGYVESVITIHHGWLVDKDGNVIDVTLRDSEGLAYYGVPFDTDYVASIIRQTDFFGTLLQKYELGYPLLTGEHPVEEAIDQEMWKVLKAREKR